ncbi:JmjC domain-containing protein [Kordiimonas sp.]|uniref:JmjC domain-containing protein n=1 Tax=Kordiimonas sp. TaxID=1970157 RepID=UPI003A90E470
MILQEAKETIARVLDPIGYDQFFDEIFGRKHLAVIGNDVADCRMLLGDDPKKTILSGYEDHAHTLTCHIRNAATPPPIPRRVPDAQAYADLIKEYHERDYTIRVPDATNLTPELAAFNRAIDIVVGNPTGTVIFWSEGGAEAPVHDDEVDVIIIQLLGQKKWFISNDPPRLPNDWKALGAGEPPMGQYSTYDVKPGDLLYLPRGTTHTVQSTSESIHLAIGFKPVTVRDAVMSMLDYLSDLDMPLRTQLGARADALAHNQLSQLMVRQIGETLQKLQQGLRSEAFIRDSLAHRHAKMLMELPTLPKNTLEKPLTANSVVRQHPLAAARLCVTPNILDFRQPGTYTLVHLGVESSMRYLMNTPEFRVGDIPGDVGDDVRIALVKMFVENGYLTVVK